MRLTLSPETETPLGCGHSTVSVRVTGVKEGSDAHLIFLQVYSGQLWLIQEQIITGVQLCEHPTDGVFTACHQIRI